MLGKCSELAIGTNVIIVFVFYFNGTNESLPADDSILISLKNGLRNDKQANLLLLFQKADEVIKKQ